MGLSASQVRFLTLTDRKHSIEGEEMILSNRRTALAMDMQRVTQKYQAALSSKVLKMSMNSGISTVDLSYTNLMTPNSVNNNKPYILVNKSDKVVVNDNYKKYAEMISPNGNPVSDWSQYRNQIISGLTGIPQSDLENSTNLTAESKKQVEEYEALRDERDKWLSNEKKYSSTENTDKIMKRLSGISGGNVTITSAQDLEKFTDNIYKSLSKYFPDETQAKLLGESNTRENLKKACDTFAQSYSDINTNSDKLKSNTTLFSSSKSSVSINVSVALEEILGRFGGTTDASGKKSIKLRDTESTEWQNWFKELQNLDNQCVNKYTEVKSAINNENQVFSAAQESEIEFYDQLFTAIAENGWVEDENASDNDYLNQMLQNNEYRIMTMRENDDYQDNPFAADYGISGTKNKYDYNTDIASNCTNIVSVNDTNARNRAEAEYEYEKYIINQKENRIDTRMTNLDTELKSINEMLKGLEQVANDNIERHMNITG